MATLADIPRLYQTVRYLKPSQIYGRLHRRPGRIGIQTPLPLRASSGLWVEPISKQISRTGDFRFSFLNIEHQPKGWNDPELGKLWLYNLHYFDYSGDDLIERWISDNPPGTGNGWEPYPTSLRICNWIKFHKSTGGLSLRAIDSLAVQAQFLSESVEYRLLANHVFANAKALAFAGFFFAGTRANRWLQQSLEILLREVREQVLPDGGHFERSTMYHSLILEDLLDLVNFSNVFPGVFPESIQLSWREAASRMLGWLSAMCHPDGLISFFNDAAFEVAPDYQALAAYASRLGIPVSKTELADSGYIRLQNETAVVLFDAAPVGPDYQPGHAHADSLSIELSCRGRRVLVNSGTSTYEAGATRLAERGTAAHNTASVDDLNSSEVWSSFRVASRARILNVSTDHRSFAKASHTGYRRLKNPVTHSRLLELRTDALTITDSFEGRGVHEIKLYFHFHPEARHQLDLDSKLCRSIENTMWRPQFNTTIPNRTIVGNWRGECPVAFVTHVPIA